MVILKLKTALHTAGAREIQIDKSGFSRREKLLRQVNKPGKA